jgi:chitodextrinase
MKIIALSFCLLVSIHSFAADTTAPSVPTGLNVSSMSPTQVGLSWISSSDDVGVAGYRIYRNGAQVGTALRNSYLDSGLTPATFYQYNVAAYDVAGNASAKSQTASIMTDPDSNQDTVAPSKPTGLTATANSTSQISLAWIASTDNVAVIGYKIYRGGVQIGTSTGTSFQNPGLSPGTTYSFTVAAYDPSGNTSQQSSPASATTASPPTTTTTTTLPPTTTTKPPVTTTTTTLPPTTTTKPPVTTTTTTLPPTTTTKPPVTTTTTLPPTTTTKPPVTTTTTTLPPTTTTKPPVTTTTTSTTTTTTLPAELVELLQNGFAVPQAQRKSVTVPFYYPQKAKSLNIVAVGFSDVDASISSVADSQGNTYYPANALLRNKTQSQRIYYAKNIKAGSNSVTVNFDRNASYPDIRIAEYSGLDLVSPLDASKFAVGKSSSIVVSGITTAKPSELLFAAGMTSSQFRAVGNGFAVVDITDPNADLSADRKVLSKGTYEFTATQAGPGDWLVQVIGFKAGGQ